MNNEQPRLPEAATGSGSAANHRERGSGVFERKATSRATAVAKRTRRLRGVSSFNLFDRSLHSKIMPQRMDLGRTE